MVERFSSGVDSIDSMLRGGFEAGQITEIYGGPGTGKTNLVLFFSVFQAKNNVKSVYIDTEKIPMERFYNFTEGDEKVSKNIIFYSPKSFLEQENVLKNIYNLVFRIKEIRILIIDSFTEYYGLDLSKNDLIASLSKQIGIIHELAKINNMVVIITSRIYYSYKDKDVKSVGEYYIKPAMDTIIKLEKLNSIRIARLEKHRTIKPGRIAKFIINDKGIVGVGDDEWE